MDQRLNGSGAPARHVPVGIGKGDIAGKRGVWQPGHLPLPLSHLRSTQQKQKQSTRQQKDATQSPARIASANETPRQFPLDNAFISMPQSPTPNRTNRQPPVYKQQQRTTRQPPVTEAKRHAWIDGNHVGNVEPSNSRSKRHSITPISPPPRAAKTALRAPPLPIKHCSRGTLTAATSILNRLTMVSPF